MTAHDIPHIRVGNPSGVPDTPPKQLAPRLASLRGMRVALLDNGKEFSDEVLGAIQAALMRDFGAIETKVWTKNSRPKVHRFSANWRNRAMP
jgi:hypothetical protein